MGYRNIAWACPFYRWDKKTDVYCEGGIVKCKNDRALKDYARKYCANVYGWEACTIAGMVRREYERKEELRNEKR